MALSALPIELIAEIASNIEDLADLTALRGTCSRIQNATADVFARRVQSIPWLMSFNTLPRLERIVGDDSVAGRLRVLRISSHYIAISQESSEPFFWELTGGTGSDIKERQRHFARHCEDQRRFATSGAGIDSLARVFGRLPRLEHVEVTDGDVVGQDVAERYNIYPERRCPGMGIFERETGFHYHSQAGPDAVKIWGLPNMRNGLGHNFELLLKALGATGKPIKSLRIWHETRTRSLDHILVRLRTRSLDHIPVHLLTPLHHLPPTTLSGLKTSISTLTTLALMLRYIDRDLTDDPSSTAAVDDFLPSLLQLTPNLAHLTLQFDDSGTYNKRQDSLITAFEAFSLRAAMPRLKVLDLRCATVRCGNLVRLWTRVRRTVRRVKLREIGLVGGSWREVFACLRGMYRLDWTGDGDVGDHGGDGGPPPGESGQRVVAAVREVEVEFSWLTEKSDLENRPPHPGYQPVGVVVFERHGLARCKRCLSPGNLDRDYRHGQDCRHVGFKGDIVVGEMEAERSNGLDKMLGAEWVSRAEWEHMAMGWTYLPW